MPGVEEEVAHAACPSELLGWGWGNPEDTQPRSRNQSARVLRRGEVGNAYFRYRFHLSSEPTHTGHCLGTEPGH